MTGRTFTASLKPSWNLDQIQQFVGSLTGTAYAYVINHDKDSDSDTGEVIENHTHILLEYDTPRKITTVANLLGVEPNFVELVKSKKAFLRYLTHMDDPDKYQYHPDEVITNNAVPYQDLIKGQNLSDKEIAQYIMEGRGFELIGVVSSSKLRTIQAFLHFDRTGAIQKELQQIRESSDRIETVLSNVDSIVQEFRDGFMSGGQALKEGLERIANEIASYKRIGKR